MKTINVEIPDGKEAKWVNGVLTLVDEQPVEFRFGFDDKVRFKGGYKAFIIYHREAVNGKPHYWLQDEDNVPYPNYPEDEIELYAEQPKDITERIKTFEDAYGWCRDNNFDELCDDYCACYKVIKAPDILAYLKLRIITCALNEGWEPTFEEDEARWSVGCDTTIDELMPSKWSFYAGYPNRVLFKSEKLAEYAATQFKETYMDFCYKEKK